jgi:hypothetical protein
VHREFLGSEYPEGLDPHSFITVTELERFRQDCVSAPAIGLAMLAVERGGAGLWIAASTGVRLVGLDIAQAGLDAARQRVRDEDAGGGNRARGRSADGDEHRRADIPAEQGGSVARAQTGCCTAEVVSF